MRPLTAGRLIAWWALALIVIVIAVTLAMCVGSTGGFGWPGEFALAIRRDRAIVAALAGMALAVAGVGYQAVLRNPLAEPYLLGASGGAALAAFAWTLAPVAIALPAVISGLGQQAFAFVGAMGAVLIVLGLAGARGVLEPTRAILVGVVVSILTGAIFALLAELFRNPGGNALSFLFGRVPDPSRVELWTIAVVSIATTLLTAMLAGSLAAVGLSSREATATGANVNRVRWMTLGIASLAAATATAVCGPIGFVGLMGPHVARLLVGPDPRRLLPVAAAVGAALLCFADAVGRFGSQALGTTIAAGIITNLMGGPFFLILLYSRRGRVVA